MIKQLSRHGNSLALVIDKAILSLLKIDAGTPLEITTDGKALIIVPVRESAEDRERMRKFEESLSRVNARHGKALKRLAE